MNDSTFADARANNLIMEAMNADTGIVYRYSDVLATHVSAHQRLEILDTPGYGRVLRLDGTTMTSERDEFFYHENLVHVPALAHTAPREVAIIGGGDGGALREMLKHACVEHVTLIELDPAVVEFSSRHLPRIHCGAFRDPRVRLNFTDGRSWLRDHRGALDLLLLDLTDPIGGAHALYTAEFYRLCRERLAPGGVAGLHVQSPIARPRAYARLVHTLRSVFTHVRPYLVFVPTYGSLFGMATASMDVDPLADSVQGVTRRMAERGLKDLRYYNPDTHFAGFALPNFVTELVRNEVPLVTDSGQRLDEDPEFAS